jgi:NAD(P)-dependent dehydrogenase (short-subunit alcohol dehydrogenase family)
MSLAGRVVAVVGGAAGIGRATAELCVQRGAHVILADVDAAQGKAAAGAIGANFTPVDVTDEAAVQACFDGIGRALGRLDALIQTAGVLEGAYVPIEELGRDIFRRVWEVNVTGSFLCAKYAVPLMKRAGRGVIVLLSSGAATGGSSSYAYASSKGGVSALGVTLARKLASDNIRVNVVAPGNISTRMKLGVIEEDGRRRGIPAERLVEEAALGQPEGVARVLAWLASDDADYVRGTITTR